MMDIVYGWLVIGLPLLFIGMYFLWRRYRTVMWMYIGALILGLGYLTVTGTVGDVGSGISALLGRDAATTEPVATPKSPEKPAAPEATAKPDTPAATPAEPAAPAATVQPDTPAVSPAEPAAPAATAQPDTPAVTPAEPTTPAAPAPTSPAGQAPEPTPNESAY